MNSLEALIQKTSIGIQTLRRARLLITRYSLLITCFWLFPYSLQPIAYSLIAGFSLLSFGCMTAEPPVVKLEKANVLPLQINHDFAFRKETQFLNDPATFRPSHSEAVNFQRRSYMWPATTAMDKNELCGNYFNFYWWNHGPAQDVTIRLEYRQAGLGNEVLAREMTYPNMSGSVRSIFKVIGDDYLENGRVTCWRALLIVNNRIVAVTQSFLWQ